MNNFAAITRYTILDQIRNRSFFIMLGIAMLFVMMIRGCYGGNYVVNGQVINNADVAWQVSKTVFQAIVVFMYLMTAMLSMKIFSRDADDGSMVFFLSRPIRRRDYVLGRVAGTWLLVTLFMFALHLTIFMTAWLKTGGMTPEFLVASLTVSINLLFIICCVCLLTLYMPDFVAALFTFGIVLAGFVSDGGHQLMKSALVKSMMQGDSSAPVALWRLVYPKIFMVQAFADSIISNTAFSSLGPVHPVLNVALFCVILAAALVAVFDRKEL
ncbi:MAG: hypothetical protein MUF22_06890 [Chitinispirillaceae bacterium]|nr:hypothetical protein [Chitinispirillaceae bacterium]